MVWSLSRLLHEAVLLVRRTVCRTALWRNASPSTKKRRGKRKAEEGLKVLRIVLEYDHKDPRLPNQSCCKKQEEERKEEEVKVWWGVKLGTKFQVILLMPH